MIATPRARILIARPGIPNASRVTASHLTVEEVPHMNDLVEALAYRKPAVLLLWLDLPGLGGTESLRDIRQISPATKIIVITSKVTDQEELEVLRSGAKGYCGPVESDVLLKMIEKVQQGEIWAGRRTIGALFDEFYTDTGKPEDAFQKSLERLTLREREILQLLANGASNKEIATALNVTVSTVKTHLTKMFRKLGQPDRLHLALYATSRAPRASLKNDA